MKILLIIPFITDFYASPDRMSSLGVYALYDELSLSHDVRILSLFRSKGNIIDMPEEMHYLNPFLKRDKSAFSFFSRYRRFGRDLILLKEYMLEFSPDVVGISVFGATYYRDIMEISKAVKALKAEVPIIVGGSGVSSFPKLFAGIPYIDTAVKGNNLKNIAKIFKVSAVSRDKKIADAGFAGNWNMVSNYENSVYPLSIVMTRGCPKRCSFCSVRDVSGEEFIRADTGELRALLNKLDQKRVWLNFEDDNISCDRDYFKSILEIIEEKKRTTDISIALTFMNGIDYSTLDENDIIRLKGAGVRYLNFTLGTLNRLTRKRMNRIQDIEKFESILSLTEKYGIDSVTYFISGLPENLPEDDMITLKYLIHSNTLIGFSPYYPPAEDRIPAGYRDIDPVFFRGSAMYPFNSRFTTEKLVTLFKVSRLFNMFKSKDKELIERHRDLLTKTISECSFFYSSNGELYRYPTDREILSYYLKDIESFMKQPGG